MSKSPEGADAVLRVLARIDRRGPRQILSKLINPNITIRLREEEGGNRSDGFERSVAKYEQQWRVALDEALDKDLIQIGQPSLIKTGLAQLKKIPLSRTGQSDALRADLSYEQWQDFDTRAAGEAWDRLNDALFCIYLTEKGSERVRELGYARGRGGGSRTRAFVTKKSLFHPDNLAGLSS